MLWRQRAILSNTRAQRHAVVCFNFHEFYVTSTWQHVDLAKHLVEMNIQKYFRAMFSTNEIAVNTTIQKPLL